MSYLSRNKFNLITFTLMIYIMGYPINNEFDFISPVLMKEVESHEVLVTVFSMHVF